MRRILVIKLGALGDFIHAFHAFAAIRAHHPADHVTLLTTPPLRDLGGIAPWFNAVRLDPRAPWWNFSVIRRTTRLIGGFDFVYDLQNSRRSRRYFWLAGRPAWSGAAWGAAAPMRWRAAPASLPALPGPVNGGASGCSAPRANTQSALVHTVERQREQLELAGIVTFPRPGHGWLTERGDLHGLTRPYALLMPGGAGAGVVKRWPVAGWAALSRHLVRLGIMPVIIGGPAETDLAAAIRRACRETTDLTARTSLPDLAAIATKAAVVVGNDTGPLHLAAFVGAPATVLFSRAGEPAQAAPRGPSGEWPIILRRPDLADLSVRQVTAAVDSMLARCRPVSRPPCTASRGQSPSMEDHAERFGLSSVALPHET